MDLWIRSQNRRHLVKCNGTIYAANYPVNVVVVEMKEQHTQEKSKIFVDDIMVGIYSYERALQVLNEIQNILQPRVVVHEPNINYDDMMHSLAEDMCLKNTQKVEMELKQVGQVVYQMPNE